MEWKRIEQVIRRTKLPMIVTEGVEEPLIIMRLTAYEELFLQDEQTEETPVTIENRQNKKRGDEVFVIDTTPEQNSAILEETAKPIMPFTGFLREDEGQNFAKISDFSASERLMF